MATQLSCSIRRRSLKEPKNKERIFIILDEDGAVSISAPLPNIPNELIIEILSRLPVKSLVRFRCVSKSWNFIISNPQFVKKHMDMLIKQDTLDPFRLIIRYPFFDLKSCSLYSLYHEPFGYGVKLHFPWKDLDGFVRIWGSCNGLVCVAIQTYTSFNMFLWNPSTKESKLLPDLLIRKQLFDFVSFGFGYDCFGDDYKVVTIGCIDESTKVMVYSLRCNSWKMLDDIPYVIAYPEESGKLVNGTLSWIANRPLSSQTGILISFDIAGEVFEELSQPNYGVRHYTLYIRVLGDCLCMLCDRTLICVEVWIMNKYGIKDSWKKLVTIPYIPHMEPLHTSNGALCFSKYGGILMYFGDVLVLYDINEKTFKYPLIFGINGCHEADIYMETLVSPNAYDGNGRDIFETSNITWI